MKNELVNLKNIIEYILDEGEDRWIKNNF
jgi:hypothetical protein